jgi:hypothetical protein
VFCAAA